MEEEESGFALPPVCPDVKELLEEYTTNLENLPIHQISKLLKSYPAPRDLDSLFQWHDTQLPLTLHANVDNKTGKLLDYEEFETSVLAETSKNSFSLRRSQEINRKKSKVQKLKGDSLNFPFWPGGFSDENKNTIQIPPAPQNDEQELESKDKLFKELFQKDLKWIPPGLEEGFAFEVQQIETNENELEKFDELGLLKVDENEIKDENLNFWEGLNKEKILEEDLKNLNISNSTTKDEKKSELKLDDIFSECNPAELLGDNLREPKKTRVIKISKAKGLNNLTILPWAEMIDISNPVVDFHKKIPDLAFKYPFELDIFQKQAILRLEEHENVFVAAHTSAGKTAVAEYAIALSARHMTRAIYTSPIKALSNQKFRDFKQNFESVGLVTGDVQINSTASCLIMTTEILRSMLYNGSDVIRDLEWVIFDEIHYLNNQERGHVWEEVLIMLPQHVSIIMLSATVPNALQFANWVGDIKKKKIYVISTAKRPVPLEHFLYTGTGGKSRNEQFLILDAEGNFLKKGYDDAVNAKNDRMSKHQKNFGPKGQKMGFNEKQEKNIFISLVSYLKEMDGLPVVVFTFSRNRCDNYANALSSYDLCTGAQKGEIHGFFQKCISMLKGSDRELPQVLQMQQMLKNGVGVHHSGILPILKEVVEMLFQKGLVKLLFATETFAMGVNMPARTVVFDSTRKHDGTCFRHLLPAEYIQMAGRAGRRGLDTTGTVILLAKDKVPEIGDLKQMLLGKAAKLESQFRLTYSMILNLLRVETISVEDVMKRSFLEAGNRNQKVEEIKEKQEQLEKELENFNPSLMDENYQELYRKAQDFINLKDVLMKFFTTHPSYIKELCMGKLVVVEDWPRMTARLGIIISSQSQLMKNNFYQKYYKVLTLFSEEETKTDFQPISNDKIFQEMIYFTHPFLTDMHPKISGYYGYPLHNIITTTADHFIEILDLNLRIDAKAIEENVKMRELPRFAGEPPSKSVLYVLEELYRYSGDILAKPENGFNLFNPYKALQFKDPQIMFKTQQFINLKDELKCNNFYSFGFGITKENFIKEFTEVYSYMKMSDEKKYCEFLLSPKSLQLHEEYQSRIKVLKKMNYIDEENLVQLKGRVACEMGNQNELMLTEMILNNILAPCAPEEIAAVLSCLVCEAKNIDDPEIPTGTNLFKKINEIKELARHIGETQREFNLQEPVQQFVEQFKFGLVEVIYEWARGKPFAEIMKLTNAQEGLIVRTIQRLDELLRDVKDAARIIGDPSLKKKMEEASECIKRDIVFAASLYTQ